MLQLLTQAYSKQCYLQNVDFENDLIQWKSYILLNIRDCLQISILTLSKLINFSDDFRENRSSLNISLIIEVKFTYDPLLLRKKPTNKNIGKIPADSHNMRLFRITYL